MLYKIGILIVINLSLYFKTLRFKFVSDDFTVWRNPPVFKNPWHKAWLRFIGAAKVLSPSVHFVKTNGKNFVAIVKTEEFEHFLTLLIHIAICISIYFAFGHNQISFIAALLYSVHPVNNQATIWPGGRGYALPILSLMLAMSFPILSPILLYFCSWFTIGFLAPLTLIGSPQTYLLVLMPFIWFLHSRKFKKAITLKNSMESFYYDQQFNLTKITIFFKTCGFYLMLCIFPFRISFYHNFLQSMSGNDLMRAKAYKLDRYFYFGLLSFITMIYLCITHWGPFAWAFLAFWIAIAPFGNVVRANQEIAERFAALPNVFVMYGMAQILINYPIAIAALMAFYAARSYYTVNMYKDEYWITEYACMEDPYAWWAWHCRGMKRWDTQSYKEALTFWVMALMISPKEYKVLMNLATCLRLLKNDKEADLYLKMAEENIVRGQEKECAQHLADHRRGNLPIML